MRKLLFSLGLLLGVGVSQASELPNDAIYVWTSPTTYDCYLISGTPTITYDDNNLVIEVNGVEVTDTTHFKYELYKYKVGETIEIKYERNGSSSKTKVTLGSNSKSA